MNSDLTFITNDKGRKKIEDALGVSVDDLIQK